MKSIRLYNSETEIRRNLFAGVFHSVLQHQYPDSSIATASSRSTDLPIQLEGTEHTIRSSATKSVYGRTYLAVSTSPETGINRRLNRISKITELKHSWTIERAILALGIECPRDCAQRAREVARTLGRRGIQFELWEAKHFRQQIRAAHSVICPAFHVTHLRQLALRLKLGEPWCTTIPDTLTLESSTNAAAESDVNASVGTLFVSYASEDRSFVQMLVEKLDRFAQHVWYDRREILVGDSIVDAINAGLQEATAVVAVLSPNSVSKPWIVREVSSTFGRQVSGTNVKVLPIVIQECKLPPLMADIRFADFTKSFDEGFNELLIGLQGITY